jgi:hypothetical protein
VLIAGSSTASCPGFVLTQAEEDGMAEPAIRRPFGEAHLRHQLGLDPMRPLWRCGGEIGGRSGLDRQLLQSASQIAKHRAGKAGADAAGIVEVSAGVVIAQQ